MQHLSVLFEGEMDHAQLEAVAGAVIARRRRIAAFYLAGCLGSRRRWWVRPINQRRSEHGDFNHLIQELRLDDVESHYAYFRMSKELFDKILTLVGPKLQRQTTRLRKPLSPAQRLAITLRFLATGETYSSLSLSFRCGKSTVSMVVPETANAIWDVLWPTYMPVPKCEMWKRVATEFWERWQFPMCIGALDGKHVRIRVPPNAESMWYNCKETNSIVLLALCDADYKYIIVDAEVYDKQSDGGTFRESNFGEALLAGAADLPPAATIPGTSFVVPPVIVADEAFPLLPNLLRPYPKQNLTAAQTIFNRRLSRARRVVENVFGVTCAKWRAMLNCLYLHPDNAQAVVKAICALHNYVRAEESALAPDRRRYCPEGYVDHEDRSGNVVEGRWRLEVGGVSLGGLGRQGANMHSRNAAQVRETFLNYFSYADGDAHSNGQSTFEL